MDPDTITWVTFEEAHVAEFRDPPNVERAPAGSKLEEMLLAGEIDAAVTGDAPITDPRIVPVIPDADEVSRLLAESIKAAGSPEMNPCGIEANRRNLEVAIDYVHRQGLIPQRYSVEELFA